MAKPYIRIPASVREDVIRRIIAGQYRCDIARACLVSEFSVTKIAALEKLKVAKCIRGTRRGTVTRVGPKPYKQAEFDNAAPINWRAVKAALRWNCRSSGGYCEY